MAHRVPGSWPARSRPIGPAEQIDSCSAAYSDNALSVVIAQSGLATLELLAPLHCIRLLEQKLVVLDEFRDKERERDRGHDDLEDGRIAA